MTRMLLPLLLVSALVAGCSVKVSSRSSTAKRKKSEPVASAAPAPSPAPQPVAKVEPVRPPAPRPPLIRIAGIRSDKPHSSPDKALHDAIQIAQYRIMESLQKLDPPLLVKPSLARIRSEYLRKDSIRETQPTSEQMEKLKAEGLESNRYWVEIDVELSEAQVQRLRAGERVTESVRGAGLLLALVAAAYGFLRLDAWSKGYLTLWLALAAAGVVAVASFALAW